MTENVRTAASSTPVAAPTSPAGRVERALGITDRQGWLRAWWQSLVVGTAFVAISLAGYHAPTARQVPVAVVAAPQQAAELVVATAHSAPGQYRLRTYDPATADRLLRRGKVSAVVDLRAQPTLRYAGAQGPTVFAALVKTLVPSVAVVGRSAPALVDVLPLRIDDAAALPLFYLSFAVVLSSYLFAITTTTQARRLGAWGHWTSAAALAVSLGVTGALIARFGTHTIGAHAPLIALVLVLTSLATGASSYLLLRVSSTVGSVLGTIILVILGSASGGVVPASFLPPWLAGLRGVLPMGVSLVTDRDITYFGGRQTLHGLVVLALWAVLPLGVARLLTRRRATGTTPG